METTASFSVLIDEGGRSCRIEKLHNCRLSGLGQLNSRTLCCHGSRHDGIKRNHPDEKKGPWRKMSLPLGSTRQKRSLIMEMLSPHCSSQHPNFGHPNMSTVESLQNRKGGMDVTCQGAAALRTPRFFCVLNFLMYFDRFWCIFRSTPRKLSWPPLDRARHCDSFASNENFVAQIKTPFRACLLKSPYDIFFHLTYILLPN